MDKTNCRPVHQKGRIDFWNWNKYDKYMLGRRDYLWKRQGKF